MPNHCPAAKQLPRQQPRPPSVQSGPRHAAASCDVGGRPAVGHHQISGRVVAALADAVAARLHRLQQLGAVDAVGLRERLEQQPACGWGRRVQQQWIQVLVVVEPQVSDKSDSFCCTSATFCCTPPLLTCLFSCMFTEQWASRRHRRAAHPGAPHGSRARRSSPPPDKILCDV